MERKPHEARVISHYLSRLEEIGMKLEIDQDDFMAYLERKNADHDQIKRLTEIRQQNLNHLSRSSLRK